MQKMDFEFEVEKEMEFPKYYDLVRLVAQIGAVIGIITGVVMSFGGIAAFKYGLLIGMTVIIQGLATILVSIAGLGITYCFLAIVRAQIESRNAIVQYTINNPSTEAE